MIGEGDRQRYLGSPSHEILAEMTFRGHFVTWAVL